MKIHEDIKQIKGIGDKSAALFNKLGVNNVQDLLELYPKTYITYPEITSLKDVSDGNYGAFELTCISDFLVRKGSRVSILTGKASDGENLVSITYFNANYYKSTLVKGASFVFYGKLNSDNNRFSLEQPVMYSKDEYLSMLNVPQSIYPLTKGLTNKLVKKSIYNAITDNDYLSLYKEYLPEYYIKQNTLISTAKAIHDIHIPDSINDVLLARKRLAFDELFIFLYSLRQIKGHNEKQESNYKLIDTALPNRIIEMLPYKLTNAQLKAFDEIRQDLLSGYVMNRMIQGDVGSGKTIVAFLSLFLCTDNGYQGALMAPTELLAAQHYNNLCELKEKYKLNINPVLLTGSVSAKNKKEIYENIKLGNTNIIVGTHALIQDKVEYKNLALVITDEQHRFGVLQRRSLNQKSLNPHVLVMSATPIPRSLSMVLYGDMHLSVINERPSQRLPIKNCVVGTNFRPKAYDFILSEIKNAHQVYIVCPMIEETEELSNVESVISYAEALKRNLPGNINIGTLHGDMKPDEKKYVMNHFANKDIDILVSTTVIEVGIDVPNATVMMIENAERFGLAQLHQLRGRIGRGASQSYCIFINSDKTGKNNKRLEILNNTNDGFKVAEEDLKLRGAGDIFGIRQSGEMDFRIADIFEDSDLILSINDFLDNVENNTTTDEMNKLNLYLSENKDKFIDFSSI